MENGGSIETSQSHIGVQCNTGASPNGTHDDPDTLAKATGRSKSFLALDAIQQYIQQEAWQVEQIEAGAREADAGEFASDELVVAARERLGVNQPT